MLKFIILVLLALTNYCKSHHYVGMLPDLYVNTIQNNYQWNNDLMCIKRVLTPLGNWGWPLNVPRFQGNGIYFIFGTMNGDVHGPNGMILQYIGKGAHANNFGLKKRGYDDVVSSYRNFGTPIATPKFMNSSHVICYYRGFDDPEAIHAEKFFLSVFGTPTNSHLDGGLSDDVNNDYSRWYAFYPGTPLANVIQYITTQTPSIPRFFNLNNYPQAPQILRRINQCEDPLDKCNLDKEISEVNVDTMAAALIEAVELLHNDAAFMHKVDGLFAINEALDHTIMKYSTQAPQTHQQPVNGHGPISGSVGNKGKPIGGGDGDKGGTIGNNGDYYHVPKPECPKPIPVTCPEVAPIACPDIVPVKCPDVRPVKCPSVIEKVCPKVECPSMCPEKCLTSCPEIEPVFCQNITVYYCPEIVPVTCPAAAACPPLAVTALQDGYQIGNVFIPNCSKVKLNLTECKTSLKELQTNITTCIKDKNTTTNELQSCRIDKNTTTNELETCRNQKYTTQTNLTKCQKDYDDHMANCQKGAVNTEGILKKCQKDYADVEKYIPETPKKKDTPKKDDYKGNNILNPLLIIPRREEGIGFNLFKKNENENE